MAEATRREGERRLCSGGGKREGEEIVREERALLYHGENDVRNRVTREKTEDKVVRAEAKLRREEDNWRNGGSMALLWQRQRGGKGNGGCVWEETRRRGDCEGGMGVVTWRK